METQYTAWVIVGWFLVLFSAERIWPLRRRTRSLGRRAILNAFAVGLAFGVAAITVGPVMRATAEWTGNARFGLLQWIALPAPLAIGAGILLLDLSFYYWHRLNHAAPLLWRFHNVHHVDPDLDSTTSFRFHFGEIAYSAGFRAVQIALIGPSVTAMAAYQLLFLAGTLFHHSNVKLPLGLERALNLIFVTPRMHGIHHSVVRDETNSNYSVVFRWWDPLHRTLRIHVPQNRIQIGVAAYTREEDHALGDLLWLPFRRQREYWTMPNGTPSRSRAGSPPTSAQTLAA